MVTIKSYTDIEQSKKLAEILPFESADMYYPWYIEEDGDTIKSGHRISIPSVGKFIHKVNKMILPCWSLAVLLSILPNTKLCHYDSYFCQYMGRGDEFPTYSTNEYNNPVDTCVEMILKLHELNLL